MLHAEKGITMYKDKQLLEDIYDLLKAQALSPKQNNDWAILARHFEAEAKRNLHDFLSEKSMSWNGETNTITIGSHIELSVKFI